MSSSTPCFLVVACLMTASVSSAHLPFRAPVFVDENALSPVAKYGGPVAYEIRDWVKIKHTTPRMSRVTPGRRVELECEANGSPPPNVQWYHNANPVSPALQESNSVGGLRLGSVKARLLIDCVSPSDQGTYTCVAASGTETVFSQPSMVYVQGNNGSGLLPSCSQTSPRILTWSPNVMETIGNDVVLPCASAGSPQPQVYWVDSKNNLLSFGSETQSDYRYKVLDSGELVISGVRWSDMGHFTCVAESPLGRDSVTTFLYPMSNDR